MQFVKPRGRITLSSQMLQIDGQSVGIVESTKFLGVVIDSNLSFGDHIDPNS